MCPKNYYSILGCIYIGFIQVYIGIMENEMETTPDLKSPRSCLRDREGHGNWNLTVKKSVPLLHTA